MGRKGPRAKTKTVLKFMSKMQQLGSMPNLKFQTLLNKNPPTPLSVRHKKSVTQNASVTKKLGCRVPLFPAYRWYSEPK